MSLLETVTQGLVDAISDLFESLDERLWSLFGLCAGVGGLWLVAWRWVEHLVSIHWQVAFSSLAFLGIFLLFALYLAGVAVVFFVWLLGDVVKLILLLLLLILYPPLGAVLVSVLGASFSAFWVSQALVLLLRGCAACVTWVSQAAVWAIYFVSLTAVAPDFLWSGLFVFRPPRYRWRGPVCEAACGTKKGTTCGECSALVRSSPLLTGTALLLTSPTETHPSRNTGQLGETAPACHLCFFIAAVSSPLWPGGSATRLRSRAQDYGTFSVDQTSSRQVDLKVRHQQRLGYRPTLSITLQPSARSRRGRKDLASSSFLPSRLVKISSRSVNGEAIINACLVETAHALPHSRSQPRPRPPYLALSHCWGDSRTILVLRRSNLEDFKRAIPLEALAKNFQDAIRITASLGVEYLWIDSLCIIQGDTADWETEAAQMGNVYESALCTISATAARDAKGGCSFPPAGFAGGDYVIGTDLLSSLVVRSPLRNRDGLDYLFRAKVETAPVSARGWTFQERVLSGRVLHFAQGILLFECNTLLATEHHPRASPTRNHPAASSTSA